MKIIHKDLLSDKVLPSGNLVQAPIRMSYALITDKAFAKQVIWK